MNDVECFDRPWTADKIQILVEGSAEITLTGENGKPYDTYIEGMTLYEMRCKAFDGGNPDLIVESAQFDAAARSIVDDNVRAVVMLVTRAQVDPDHIASLLGDHRSGYQMLRRAQELILREQRRRARSRRRKRGDKPVCWRCMKATVARAGDECDPTCVPKPPDFRPKSGPGAPYDPTERPSPSDMTDDEKEAEWNRIAKGQRYVSRTDEPIVGQDTYRHMVVPYGLDPSELDEHGESWQPLS